MTSILFVILFVRFYDNKINSKHEEIIIKIELKIHFDLAHNFLQ